MEGTRRFIICLWILTFGYCGVQAQHYLVLDRYGTKRIRIHLGEEVVFTLKGDKRKHRSRIVQLADSLVIMGNHDIYLHLEDFEAFYFHRRHWKALRQGSLFTAAGFLLGAAAHPLVDNPFYDQGESAITGLALLAVGQSFRLLEWKKFRITGNARIWIGGWE